MNDEAVKQARQGQPEHLLTAREVADFMHVHVSSIGRWSREGKIKFYRVGFRGDMRFAMEDVIQFMKESKQHRAAIRSKNLSN